MQKKKPKSSLWEIYLEILKLPFSLESQIEFDRLKDEVFEEWIDKGQKNSMRVGVEIGQTKIAFIDAIDFECELESTTTRLYSSAECLAEQRDCAMTECGAYKLEIKAVEYLSPEKLKSLKDLENAT